MSMLRTNKRPRRPLSASASVPNWNISVPVTAAVLFRGLSTNTSVGRDAEETKITEIPTKRYIDHRQREVQLMVVSGCLSGVFFLYFPQAFTSFIQSYGFFDLQAEIHLHPLSFFFCSSEAGTVTATVISFFFHLQRRLGLVSVKADVVMITQCLSKKEVWVDGVTVVPSRVRLHLLLPLFLFLFCPASSLLFFYFFSFFFGPK